MNIIQTFKFICIVHNSRTTFRDIIGFLYGETPPENNDYFSAVKPDSIVAVARTDAGKKNKPLFSVVLATYNRAHLIKYAIDSLIGQKGISPDEYEIIIVNDGSGDETDNMVRDYINRCKNSRMILITLSQNHGSSFARNAGILNSSSDFIAVTDDDCIMPPDWLLNFKQSFDQNPDIVAVGGWKIPHRTEKNQKPSIYDNFLYWRRLPYMTHEYKSIRLDPFNNCGDTANVCYRKSVLKEVGGFNHYLRTWNDWELKVRLHSLGKPLLFQPHHIFHEADLTLNRYNRHILLLGWDSFLASRLHPAIKIFETCFLDEIIKALIEIKKMIIADYCAPAKKSMRTAISFSFLSVLLHFNLWLGKYYIPFK